MNHTNIDQEYAWTASIFLTNPVESKYGTIDSNTSSWFVLVTQYLSDNQGHLNIVAEIREDSLSR